MKTASTFIIEDRQIQLFADNWEDFDSKNAYPIMNSKLAAYLGYDDATEEEVETENSQYANFTTPNRYKKVHLIKYNTSVNLSRQ